MVHIQARNYVYYFAETIFLALAPTSTGSLNSCVSQILQTAGSVIGKLMQVSVHKRRIYNIIY